MKFDVHLAADAETDLLEIYRYVANNDSVEQANRLLDRLEASILRLETLPGRGHVPPELERAGVLDYREIHFKPYRIIYEISKAHVYIHCVLDGRRDLQELLYKRIIRC